MPNAPNVLSADTQTQGEAMNITRVVVNGRSGIAAGVGMGPNAGKRYILWDGTDTADWVPAGDLSMPGGVSLAK